MGQKKDKNRIRKVRAKTYIGFPDDLEESKIVFIRYEKFNTAGKDKLTAIQWGSLNKKGHFDLWNTTLEENVKGFPFEYAIIDLDQLEEYKKKGYKYIFEYFQSPNIQREKDKWFNFDFGVYSGSGAQYRFRNIDTGEMYYLRKTFGVYMGMGKFGLAPLSNDLPDIIQYLKKEYKID
ncbi:MAG: hypothetical protein R3B93_19060 [Bacteroidia bacterium]